MKVGIVVPAYNTEAYLPGLLDSILAQTHTEWNCVIVDDGSTDKTYEVTLQYTAKDQRFHGLHKRNEGCSQARNDGHNIFGEYEADAFLFVDSDDVLLSHALTLLTAELEQADKVIGGVFGECYRIDEAGRPHMWNKATLPPPSFFWHVPPGGQSPKPAGPLWTFNDILAVAPSTPITTPGVMLLRRELLNAVKWRDGFLWDPSLPVVEDMDFWFRASAESPFKAIGYQVLEYRQRAGQSTQNSPLMIEWVNTVLKRIPDYRERFFRS